VVVAGGSAVWRRACSRKSRHRDDRDVLDLGVNLHTIVVDSALRGGEHDHRSLRRKARVVDVDLVERGRDQVLVRLHGVIALVLLVVLQVMS
jgi:hypothetical protein